MARPLPAVVAAATAGDVTALRHHILEAAQRVIDKKGLATASTRAIAEEAGVSAGTLYNYFDDHTTLIAKSIAHHAKHLTDPVATLPSRVGKFTVGDNLRFFVRRAATALDHIVPLLAAAFSDSELLEAVRREIAGIDRLNDPAELVERYLIAERAAGRVGPRADCKSAASIIVSICHDDAFQRYLHGGSKRPKSRRKEIELIVWSLTHTTG